MLRVVIRTLEVWKGSVRLVDEMMRLRRSFLQCSCIRGLLLSRPVWVEVVVTWSMVG